MRIDLATHVLVCLLDWIHPNPRNVARLTELVTVAADLGRTDASETEAEMMAAIAIHESQAKPRAVGDHGKSRGAFQVQVGSPDAQTALNKARSSIRICGDLSLYAGCGRCGACPEIVESLWDPTLPRR